jgi:hypothetical protein
MPIKSIDGYPVIDATRDRELEILERDCTNGDRRKPGTCAAARAAKRELHARDVRVHITRVYIRSNDGNFQRYIASEPLKQEVVVFDRGGRMMPGKYMLLAPKKSQRIGHYHKGKKAAKPSGKKRRSYHRLTNVRAAP